MNINDLENALMSTIVDYITDQVILRYADASKQAAVLFTGAMIGLQDAMDSLKKLKEDNWKFTVVLSKAAGEIITAKRIEEELDPIAIYVEGAPVNGRQIIDSNQFVIIPTLTINTAAKVANCINDNLITNMIYRAMTSGKPIVAAVDGCCPDNKVREQMGFKVTEAYKARLRSNLADMITYGITLTTDADLAGKVDEVFSANLDFPVPSSEEKPDRPVCVCQAQEKVNGASIKLDKKVIGRADIGSANCQGASVVIVPADAVITSLATDEAKRFNITIIKE